MDPRARAILQFWLGDDFPQHAPSHVNGSKQKIWWAGSADTDMEVTERFGPDIEAAAAGKLSGWRHGYEALASVILQDQLTRNMYRGTPQMCSLDGQALALAEALVASGEAGDFIPPHRVWLFMPYMHSESLADQEAGVRHFKALHEECQALPGGGEPISSLVAGNIKYAEAHRDVVQRWGRFPHRNALMGRQSTPEEEAGLKEGSIPRF